MSTRPALLPWAIGLAVIAAAFFAPSVDLPGDPLGVRRFRSPAVSPDLMLSQTFEMTGNGLRAVEFRPVPVGGAAAGAIRLSLVDVARQQPIRTADVEAAALLAASEYRFAFEPVAESHGRVYRLDLASVETRPAAGVGVWATRGERYRRGVLLFNGSDRWADMAFHADAPAPAIGLAIVTLPRTVWGLRAGDIVLAALVLQWLALCAVFLRLQPSSHS